MSDCQNSVGSGSFPGRSSLRRDRSQPSGPPASQTALLIGEVSAGDNNQVGGSIFNNDDETNVFNKESNRMESIRVTCNCS